MDISIMMYPLKTGWMMYYPVSSVKTSQRPSMLRVLFNYSRQSTFHELDFQPSSNAE